MVHVQQGPVPAGMGPRTHSLVPEAASLFRGHQEASPGSRAQHEASPLSVARLGAALRSATDLPRILHSSAPPFIEGSGFRFRMLVLGHWAYGLKPGAVPYAGMQGQAVRVAAGGCIML